MKILIIKFRNIGDILLSTPLIENLKLNNPNSQIDIAINANCKEMLTSNPFVNTIFEYNRSSIKSGNFISRISREIQFVKNIVNNNYDIIINLTEGDRGAIIALLSRAKEKLGFKPRKGLLKYLSIYTHTGNDQTKIHTVEKDMQFIKLLNKSILNKKVSIFWKQEDETKVNTILQTNHITNYIHIHPVSRWMFKCWEDDRMAQVIDYFENEKNIKVVITASDEQKEKEHINQILSLCHSNPLNLTGLLNLKELAFLSSRADLFFGIDSAPMHIAAAVDTPVVALMGGSEAKLWGPWDNDKLESSFENEKGIQKNGKHTIISDTDHTIFYHHNIKKCQGMVNITPEQVLKILDETI